MKSYVPHAFETGAVLDSDKINENLDAIRRDVNRNLRERYTYCTAQFDISGMADTLGAVLRTFRLPVPSGEIVSVVGVELVVYATSGVTWTLSATDFSLSVATAGATTEAVATRFVQPIYIDGNFDFTLSASAASTITKGHVILHLRADRGSQGASHAFATTSGIDSSAVASGTDLDTKLGDLEDAVERDTNNASDLTCEIFTTRTVSRTDIWRMPAGKREFSSCVGIFASASAGANCTFFLNSNSTTVTSAGTLTLLQQSISSVAFTDDPADSTDDVSVSLITSASATPILAYLVLWSK